MKKINKCFLFYLCLMLIFVGIISADSMKVRAAELNHTKITLSTGKSKRLKLINNRTKVSWSIVSGKKNIALRKKDRTGVTVIGKKAGKAVIMAKTGKQEYICRITVKKAESSRKLYNVKITVGSHTLHAKFEDNVTTRELVKRMPVTLPMMDLYEREMCYRFGNGTFPTEKLREDGYAVGDIAYWPPAGSLVILYKQDGEEFERQHLGHIDSGVEIFAGTGDTDVTFELIK